MISLPDHHNNVLIVIFYTFRSAQLNMNGHMYQMFNFKDVHAFINDLLSTISNSLIEDLCHTEAELATPFRSFTSAGFLDDLHHFLSCLHLALDWR